MSEDILNEIKAELVALRTDVVLMKYSIDKIESQMEMMAVKKAEESAEDGYTVERL